MKKCFNFRIWEVIFTQNGNGFGIQFGTDGTILKENMTVELQKNGKIVRIGNSRSGKWQVKD